MNLQSKKSKSRETLNPTPRRDAFEAAAISLECDLSEEAFNAALGKIARAEPVDPPVGKSKAEKAKPAK
jgi:hypothetical protein